MRSRTRRACCASTKCVSTCRGCSNAARIALGVISLNVTRKIFFGSVAGMSLPGVSFAVSSAASFFSDFFLKREALGLLLGEFRRFRQNHGQMRGDGFSLAIRVARQVYGVGGLRGLPKIVDHLSLAGDDLQRGLENLVVVERDDGLARCLLFDLLSLAAFFLSGFSLPVALLFAGQTNADRLLRQVHYVADGRLDRVIRGPDTC